jgi:hypothetical protein
MVPTGGKSMRKGHSRGVWLGVLVIVVLALVCVQMGYVPVRGSAVTGPTYALEASATSSVGEASVLASLAHQELLKADALQGKTGLAAAPLLAQASPTAGPFQAEVLPPVLSAPVLRGTGLFDEIADRLLRSLLNIF